MMITREQIRGARAMLGISQKQLAEAAGIAIATLNNIERGAQTDPKLSTMKAIQASLEKAGINFTADTLEGVSVTLRPHQQGTASATVLIVDDQRADRMLYKNWLSQAGEASYHVVEAENARSGIDAFLTYAPDCLILDFMMYGTDGFQLLAALKREHATLPPIIFITAMHNDLLEESVKAQGVYCYLHKQQLTPNLLRQTIAEAIREQHHAPMRQQPMRAS